MAEISQSAVADRPVVEAGAIDAVDSVPRPKWFVWRQRGKAFLDYLLDSEVHTYAFSVAANSILSFIPFVVLLYTLALSVFHSQTMARIVTEMVNYYFPTVTKQPNWLATNIEIAAAGHGVQAFSVLMILIACTGIFLPLEVALNQAWGVAKSRNYIVNQMVALGLVLVMVLLGVASVLLNLGVQQFLTAVFFHHTDNLLFNSISYFWLVASTGVASILFFFSIYWLLPHRRVPWRPVLRAAVMTGIVWLAARSVFLAALPHFDLYRLYGPFYVSVGLLFWAYVSGLILFAGAQFSVVRLNGAKTAGK